MKAECGTASDVSIASAFSAYAFAAFLPDHARLHVDVHLQGRSRLKKKMWRRQLLKPCALDCSALIWLLTLSSVKSEAS